MCTVSWSLNPDGYDLFFNRDELKRRSAEFPPALARQGDVVFVTPRDGDHGGTWLLANEFGVTVCLLNDYANRWRPSESSPIFSRGHVVLGCAAAKDLGEVIAAVQQAPLSRTSPFRLLALVAGKRQLMLHWTGVALVSNEGQKLRPPLSSSSYATDTVIATRTQRYGDFVHSPGEPATSDLFAYHRQHTRSSGADSVLMERPDASTRSIIHVQVNGERVNLAYESVRWSAAGPTFQTPLRLTMQRRSAAVCAA